MRLQNLGYPFTGHWLVQNSPADRVPSHGTRAFATSHAIDFVPSHPDGSTARVTLATLVRTEPPDRFPGLGRPILAPVDGRVVAASDDLPDHHAHRGLASIAYAVTQAHRVSRGWAALAGNHVIIRTADGLYLALCHLRQGSLLIGLGAQVHAGQEVAACGNSGNSTEPHLHLQCMDGPDPATATDVLVTFRGVVPRNGEVVLA